MNGSVLVRGDGVAAVCCVRSLAAHDLPLHVVRTARPKLAALLLSEATQSLLTDLFADTTLFEGFPRIRKRVVAWGPGAEPVVLPHSALVIPEKDLIERLWNRVPSPNEGVPDIASWEIVSSRMESPAAEEKHFGTRSALVAEVQLKASADREACWAESLEDGWLFLFPLRSNSACLIAVGEHDDSLLGQSRLISAQIEAQAPAARRSRRRRASFLHSVGMGGSRAGRQPWPSIRFVERARRMRCARLFWRQPWYGRPSGAGMGRVCWLTTTHA